MASIEIVIAGQKYVLTGEEPAEHLNEVSELVRRRVESIRKKTPGLNIQKAAMLVALDLASEYIKQKRRGIDTRNGVVNRAQKLLERVEGELKRSGSSASR